MIEKILLVIGSVILGGLIGIFCLFSCILAPNKNEIYDKIKFKDGKDDRH